MLIFVADASLQVSPRISVPSSCAGLSICGRKSLETFSFHGEEGEGRGGGEDGSAGGCQRKQGKFVSNEWSARPSRIRLRSHEPILAVDSRFDEQTRGGLLSMCGGGLSRVSFVGRRNDKFSSQLSRARHHDPPTCTTEIILSGPDLSPNEQHYRDSAEDTETYAYRKQMIRSLSSLMGVRWRFLNRGHLGISQLIGTANRESPRIIIYDLKFDLLFIII